MVEWRKTEPLLLILLLTGGMNAPVPHSLSSPHCLRHSEFSVT